MNDRELYARILGIEAPWEVSDVDLKLVEGEVTVRVRPREGATLHCSQCGRASPGYDHRARRWRHLDTCQYKTLLEADVPRVRCPEHGVVTIRVPWAEPGSGYTALFEALVIDWLKEASISAVCRQLRLGWNAVAGIMDRAVRRGLARRETSPLRDIGVDEVSFRKRHDYLTIVSTEGRVLYAAEGRRKTSLSAFYEGVETSQLAGLRSVSMDMWPAYIQATLDAVPDAREKVAFDKFHVAKHLGEAVDKVRREEHRTLQAMGRGDLTGTRNFWRYNPENMSQRQWRAFRDLRNSALKTARAWAIKEFGMSLWGYVRRGWARKGWKRWLSWAQRCRLKPMVEVARTVREHLWGILNAVVLKVSNGPAEGLNSRIKSIKVKARGFRNRERFISAIYFHLGDLDLYPETAKAS